MPDHIQVWQLNKSYRHLPTNSADELLAMTSNRFANFIKEDMKGLITGIPGFFGADAPIYISYSPCCGALIWCDAGKNAPMRVIAVV
jgi:hypothetical protein